MTDEITPQSQPPLKKDEKKVSAASGNTRGTNKRSVSTLSNSKSAGGGSAQGPRPSSRTSNGSKKSPGNSQPELGLDSTAKKVSETGRKPDQQRPRNASNPSRNPSHRKAQQSASQGGRNSNPKEQPAAKQAFVSPSQSKESSDALSSLQRVIADLKTTSPVQLPNNHNNGFSMPVHQPHSGLQSNPSVLNSGIPGFAGPNADPKHRKAVSLGAGNLSGNFNSFSPHLGAMLEDAEDGIGGTSFEEGEIQDQHRQPTHQPRTQSQSFVAPRFAALAAQQEQADSLGPTGRPQLAPGFMFGARKRGGPVGPPISEEDVGFQFPQQQQQSASYHTDLPVHEQAHRRTESGEITGIMAEQVSSNLGI